MIYCEGDTGSVVRLIQRAGGVVVDGVWGPKTTEAVKAWQQAQGLAVDGLVGPASMAQLLKPEPEPIHGIDVSHYQGKIDWAQVKRAGICFVYCKATQGNGSADPTFGPNVIGANSAGLLVGAYHFAVADHRAGDAVAEARACVARMDGYQLQLPPALDLETNSDKLTPAELEQWALDWLAEMHRLTLRRSILYSGSYFLRAQAGSGSRIAATGCRYWVARYRGSQATDPGLLAGFSDWTIWQNSGHGKVPGITGAVDLDVLHGGSDSLAALVGD